MIRSFYIILILLFATPSFAAEVKGIRIADRDGFSRLVLDIDNNAGFKVSDAGENKIRLDIKGARWSVYQKARKYKSTVIREVNIVEGTGNDLSLEIVLSEKSKIGETFVILPSETSMFHRLVLDITPLLQSDSPLVMVKIPGQEKIQSPPILRQDKKITSIPGLKKIPTPTPRPKRPVIIIDPGHGGVDPGAIAPSGKREKDITLAYARELKKNLSIKGLYKVILTREKDKFLSLKERVRIAKKHKADLFISLHADSHEDSRLRGLSVYTVSEKASDKEAEKLAERENKSEALTKVDLTKERDDAADVLIELVKRETMNNSARFAEIAVKELGNDAKLLSNSHRFAGFVVLRGIDIPSALVELGYMSNNYEVEMLGKDEYKKKIAKALAIAVENYFNNPYDYENLLAEEVQKATKKNP